MSTDNATTDTAGWDAISARLAGGKAERWQPTEGEQLLGTVTSIDYRAGEYGAYAFVTVAHKDTQQVFSVRAGHQSLVRQLTAQRVQVGDRIGILYEGQITTDSGSTPHRYNVAVMAQGPRIAGAGFDLANVAQDDLGLVDMGPNP